MNMGEGLMMIVNARAREAAGCRAGDVVQVQLELDEEEGTVDVPPCLEKVIAGDKAATEGWSMGAVPRVVRSVSSVAAAVAIVAAMRL